jgi:hypothetical protein
VTALSFGGVNPLVEYTYFGLNRFASTTYDEPSPPISNVMATSAPTYGGFDAFNRVTNVVWSQDGSDLVELEYGYDLATKLGGLLAIVLINARRNKGNVNAHVVHLEICCFLAMELVLDRRGSPTPPPSK